MVSYRPISYNYLKFTRFGITNFRLLCSSFSNPIPRRTEDAIARDPKELSRFVLNCNIDPDSNSYGRVLSVQLTFDADSDMLCGVKMKCAKQYAGEHKYLTTDPGICLGVGQKLIRTYDITRCLFVKVAGKSEIKPDQNTFRHLAKYQVWSCNEDVEG